MIRPATALAALVLAAMALPAAAQWVAVGRWGSERDFRFVPPGTWMMQVEGDSVTISAEGDHHEGRLAFRCSASDPAGELRFTGYRGDALDSAADTPLRERMQFVIGGQRFERVFDYRPEQRDWVGEAALEPGFLEVFAAGQRLELQNAAGRPVTGFRLTGSRAARVAVQQTCGL